MIASIPRARIAWSLVALLPSAAAQKVPDVRLDLGDAPGAADSFDPAIATEGSALYVAWTDWRDNLFPRGDIYFNRSLDSGASWLASDIRLDVDSLPGATCSASPRVAASGTNVYVVWQELRNFRGLIHFNRSTDRGATWSHLETRLDRGDSPGNSCILMWPQIAATGTSVYAVWQDNRDGRFDVYFNRSLDGGESWLADDVRLDVGTAPGVSMSHDVRIAASGSTVHVVWRDERDGDWDVYYNRSQDGGDTWLASDVRIDVGTPPGEFNSYTPQIAISSGAVYVAWLEDFFGFINSRPDVYFNRSLDGGDTWLQTSVRLDPGKVTGVAVSDNVDIAAVGSSVYVTWADRRDGDFDVFFNRSLDGGSTWLAEEVRLDVSSAPGSFRSSQVENDVAGSTIYVAWLDEREAPPGVYLNRSLDAGATWLIDDVRMNVGSGPGTGEAADPRPAAGIGGSACHVVWSERRDGADDIYYTLALGAQLYGQGKAGSGGFVPVLTASGSASIGGTAVLDIAAGLGGAQGVLIVSLDGPASIVTNLGTFLVQPPWLLEAARLAGSPGVSGAGSASVSLPIPPDVSLIGARANFQAGVVDFGLFPALALSQGLELWIL